MQATTGVIPAVRIERPPAPDLPPAPTLSAALVAAPSAAPVVNESPSTAQAQLQDNEGIQTVLRRYQTAYDDLDAAGAQAIWPTVDVRALSRAFDGLRSQDVVFDRCDLSVAGASARAVCNGRATYVRKIGSKDPQTEPRQWIFQLQKTDRSWTISQTETR